MIGSTPDWEPTVQLTIGGVLKTLYAHPKGLGITLEIFHFPEAVRAFSNSTSSPRVASTLNKTKTNLCKLNHLQTLYVHYVTPPRLQKDFEEAPKPLGQHNENFGLTSLSFF